MNMTTIKIVSWENDGDYYQTKLKSFETKQEAMNIAKMCKELFNSCNNGDNGIGNLLNEYDEEKSRKIILKYLKDNNDIEFFKYQEKLSDDVLVDYVMDLNGDLLGYSECYLSRVCESVVILDSWDEIFDRQRAEHGANYGMLKDWLKLNYQTPEKL